MMMKTAERIKAKQIKAITREYQEPTLNNLFTYTNFELQFEWPTVDVCAETFSFRGFCCCYCLFFDLAL